MHCHLCGSFASPIFEEYQMHMKSHDAPPWDLRHVKLNNNT